MKISLAWLKKHLQTDASSEEISLKLTSIGHVVDNQKDLGTELKNFKVAEVMDAQPHPNADRLKVCQVNTGKEILQVVCGAPNARKGIKVVLARPGMMVPTSGLVLKETKIRDVASFGMLCSEKELGLSDADTGTIIEVPSHAPLGEDYVDFLGIGDVIYDLDITPNRGDCLSHYGIARDLAASGVGVLQELDIAKINEQFAAPLNLRYELEDSNVCPAFAIRVIKDVKNTDSPKWLQDRLKSVGLRPISALVDVTNYIMHDMGRPMHVFDANRVQGDLTIRMSKEGEKLKALDEKEYALKTDMLVVADEKGPVSLAGIMGGLESGCDDSTTDVILESAFFSASSIARTGRELGIHSDSRHRFERGVDAGLIESMLDRATQMIVDICGGKPSQKLVVGTLDMKMPEIVMQQDAVARLCGVTLDSMTEVSILKSLGFNVEKGTKSLKVRVPTWRHDCTLEADLVEEVMRMHGYDQLVETLLPVSAVDTSHAILLNPGRDMSRLRTARRFLSARGYHEVMTWSFLKEDSAVLFGGGGKDLHIENPISADLSVMRPTLLPNLLEHMRSNRDRSQRNIKIFETGPVFKNASIDGQQTMISGVFEGIRCPEGWNQRRDASDVFDAKADVLELLEMFDIDINKVQVSAESAPWYHPGRSFKIQLGPKNILAMGGELHPKILEQFDLKPGVLGFEVFYTAIPLAKNKKTTKPALFLSPYQAVERDFAFIVDDVCTAQSVIQAINKVNPDLIASVLLFDVFKGEGIPEGKKSLALTVRLEPKTATLVESEIVKVGEDIISSVQKLTGGVLRA